MKRMLITALLLVLLFVFSPVGASEEAERDELPEELAEEIERQTRGIDLSTWDEYFSGIGDIAFGARSMRELLIRCAEGDAGDEPEGLFGVLKELVLSEFRRSSGAIAALTAAALITALSGVIADDGIKPVLSLILCGTAVTLTVGAFTSLCRTAADAVSASGKLTQSTMPIMSALLAAMGSTASEGAFRPLMAFLSGTVVLLIEKLVLPIILAGGILGTVDALADGRLEGLVKLAHRTSKWMLGLISSVYFCFTAVRGFTMAIRDGVTLRTAKFAISRLVPVVGSMVSGTVDSVMGCALLIKNGAGVVSIIILLSLTVRPLTVLLAGTFIFRISAALAGPLADPAVTKLFANTADMASDLFACAAAAGSMFLLTALMFIAAGGVSAGLW